MAVWLGTGACPPPPADRPRRCRAQAGLGRGVPAMLVPEGPAAKAAGRTPPDICRWTVIPCTGHFAPLGRYVAGYRFRHWGAECNVRSSGRPRQGQAGHWQLPVGGRGVGSSCLGSGRIWAVVVHASRMPRAPV